MRERIPKWTMRVTLWVGGAWCAKRPRSCFRFETRGCCWTDCSGLRATFSKKPQQQPIYFPSLLAFLPGMEGSTRICLEFQDRRILSKSQRKDHLRRSWLLLRPESFSTVADVAAHISDVFSLRRTCPFGLVLYMDEFVLPPFESTSIFRDSDIIRVKKKASKHKKIQIQDDAIQGIDNVARQCTGIFLEQSKTKKRKICEVVCDIKQIAMNRERFDQLHANTDSPLHDTDATDKHEQAPLQNSGKERMVEGRDEDTFKKNHQDAAPANNWEVEVAKAKSEVSATHFIEIQSDSSKDLMNQTENNDLHPQNGWDHWIANKNPAASWSWGVRERIPSRYGGKSGSYTSGKHLDSDKHPKPK